MTVLDRKLLRELRASKGLILAITSLLAVGVMCFVYMRSAYNNLRQAQDRYYAQCRLADFWIDVKKAPLAELATLAESPGISELRSRIQFYATVDLDRVAEPLNGLVLSLPDVREPVINDIVLKRGGYFTERRRNEVIVNNAFAARHGLYPGQWIHLILNNRRQELLIVGTALSSEFVYMVGPGSIVPDPEHFGVFYLKQTYAEEVFDFEGAANQVIGLLAPQYRDHPDELLRRVEAQLDSFGVFSVTPRKNQASNRFLTDEIHGLGTFANIMPFIFLAVAALVLNVLMARLIEQQRTIIGTLKGIGYTDGQIFVHFMKFGAAVGLIGGLVGLILGNRMSVLVTLLYQQIFEFPDLQNRFEPLIYLAGLVISLACALVGSMYGARSALKLRPAEAMRAKPPAQGGKILLEQVGFLWRRLSFAWRMALRNIFRNRLRTSVGLFAAAMGASLITCGYMLEAATQFMISFQFEQVMRSDLELTFKDERDEDAWQEARRLPGVVRAEPILAVACEFLNGPYRRKGSITGLVPDASLTTPRDSEGRPIRVPAAGLTMTRKLAELLHLESGDWVTIKAVKGLRQERRVQIVEISDSYLGLSVYADHTYLSNLVNEEFAMSGVQLKTELHPVATAVLNKELKRLSAVQAVNSRPEMIHNLNETLVKTQQIFIGLLIIFAGVIFLASVLNASLIGLAERRREVATLRVQGYTPWQIGGFFFRESIVVTLVGAMLGLPLGYSLAWLISKLYDTEMFRFPLVTPPSVLVKPLALAVLFGLIAHLVVQRAISRLDWRDALNVKE